MGHFEGPNLHPTGHPGDNGRMKRRKFKGKSKGKGMRVRVRGKDNTPLSMSDVKQGLYELARRLDYYRDYRVKNANFYLTVVDEHGDEVLLDRSGEWSIFPYECAADRLDDR
jgi:hypothetical protein